MLGSLFGIRCLIPTEQFFSLMARIVSTIITNEMCPLYCRKHTIFNSGAVSTPYPNLCPCHCLFLTPGKLMISKKPRSTNVCELVSSVLGGDNCALKVDYMQTLSISLNTEREKKKKQTSRQGKQQNPTLVLLIAGMMHLLRHEHMRKNNCACIYIYKCVCLCDSKPVYTPLFFSFLFLCLLFWRNFQTYVLILIIVRSV